MFADKDANKSGECVQSMDKKIPLDLYFYNSLTSHLMNIMCIYLIKNNKYIVVQCYPWTILTVLSYDIEYRDIII